MIIKAANTAPAVLLAIGLGGCGGSEALPPLTYVSADFNDLRNSMTTDVYNNPTQESNFPTGSATYAGLAFVAENTSDHYWIGRLELTFDFDADGDHLTGRMYEFGYVGDADIYHEEPIPTAGSFEISGALTGSNETREGFAGEMSGSLNGVADTLPMDGFFMGDTVEVLRVDFDEGAHFHGWGVAK